MDGLAVSREDYPLINEIFVNHIGLDWRERVPVRVLAKSGRLLSGIWSNEIKAPEVAV
jgi:hypothetical protein